MEYLRYVPLTHLVCVHGSLLHVTGTVFLDRQGNNIVCVLQDVQWNDIDYMDRSLDFTFDPAVFSTLPDMVKDLHIHGQRYVMMLVR